MSAILRRYEHGDFDKMGSIRVADSIAMGPVSNINEILLAYSLNGPAYTFIADDEVIALAGGLIVWPGVVEIWALTSDLVEKFPIFFHKSVKKLIEHGREELNLHRIQCTIHTDNQKARRWIERLGFTFEGLHEMYGPDKKDHLRYAKIWRS